MSLSLERSARPALRNSWNFWIACGVAVHTLWTSAAPALVYRLYAEQWALSPVETTGIFAIYPVFVVATLILFSDLSDHIGRRSTMQIGLAFSLLGTLAFALAPAEIWLFAGRAAMGIGVGLTSGSSTAAILEFSADGNPERSAAAANTAQSSGFAIALLLGGMLVQYAPMPLHLCFWVLAVVILGLIAATCLLPRSAGSDTPSRWQPRRPAVPANIRSIFALSAIAVVTAYLSGAVVLSLGGQVAHDLVGSSNALANGAILACYAIISGTVSLAARKVPPRRAIGIGTLASMASMLLLVVATTEHALPVFLFATIMAGTGYTLMFLGGLTLVQAVAPASHRGGVLSALYLVAYASMGSFALVLGWVAREWGLRHAIEAGSGTIILFALITLACLTPGAGNGCHSPAQS